ncbi:cytochrome b5 domain-containing protein [Thermoproteota archaeon]
MRTIAILMIIAMLILVGCAGETTEKETETAEPIPAPAVPIVTEIVEESEAAPEAQEEPEETEQGMQAYTMSDVAEHDSAEDCWILIDGRLYDLTGYIDSHPEGDEMIEGCGRDATELVERNIMLEEYEIGSVSR